MKARVSVPGTLFVVATPIGNLEDITLRALRVLKEVALVAAEDTRRTANLLRHYEIDTPLISLHQHNEHRRQVELVLRLSAGASIALVSDAGTPGVSDPGAGLVRATRVAGLRVEPVPGPSSVVAALCGTGWALERFVFAGFPPIKGKARKEWFEWVARVSDVPVVCFEAPHRVTRTLTDIGFLLVERPIIIAREMTKLHEQWLEGSATSLVDLLPDPRGEFVVVLGPAEVPARPLVTPTDGEIMILFGQITENMSGTRRTAIRHVAERLGLTAKVVYEAIERHKNSIE